MMSGNTVTADDTVADDTVADEPVADEPMADEPVADDPVADEPMADEPMAGSSRFALPPQSDIRAADEIEPRCRAALDATGDVEIVCDAVERIDAAVLQCIAALGTSLAQAERRLKLVDQSAAFSRAVDLLGFEPALGGLPAADHQPRPE